MEIESFISQLLAFLVGILSSIVATWLLLIRKKAKYRLQFRNVMQIIEELLTDIKKDGFKFDHIFALGRNSGVVGSILAGCTVNAIVSATLVKKRLPDGSLSVNFDAAAEKATAALSNKKVLILICCNYFGASLKYAKQQLENLKRPPKDIRTQQYNPSPSPMFKPTYISVVVGRDTKKTMTDILNGLPWVTNEWVHPFAKERNSDF